MNETVEYPLARNYRAAARLNLQHYIWKQTQGYLIHPDIPRNPDIKIADIGTGTGIWLTDVAGDLKIPGVQLHGFDVDISQCPPKEWLPETVSIRKLDIFGEIPDDLHDQYDIINIRAFLVVVKDSNPGFVLQQLSKMLKPNGWVQWSEQDMKTCIIETANPNATRTHTQTLLEFAIEPTPKISAESQHWVSDLRKAFTDIGFVNVKEHRNPRPRWHLSSLQDITMLAMEEISLRLPNGEEVRQKISRASQEFEENERGIAITSDMIVVVGQKAGM